MTQTSNTNKAITQTDMIQTCGGKRAHRIAGVECDTAADKYRGEWPGKEIRRITRNEFSAVSRPLNSRRPDLLITSIARASNASGIFVSSASVADRERTRSVRVGSCLDSSPAISDTTTTGLFSKKVAGLPSPLASTSTTLVRPEYRPAASMLIQLPLSRRT